MRREALHIAVDHDMSRDEFADLVFDALATAVIAKRLEQRVNTRTLAAKYRSRGEMVTLERRDHGSVRV